MLVQPTLKVKYYYFLIHLSEFGLVKVRLSKKMYFIEKLLYIVIFYTKKFIY